MPSFDVNTILAAVSTLLFIALIAYFAFLVKHQEEVEPAEKPVYGVELLEQHYAPGATVEQPTPYYVSPIPASPDPLEISANLDKKIVLGGAMLFAMFGLIGGYFVIQGDASPLNGGRGVRGAAVDRQLRQDVSRGKAIYAQLCYDCHGREGKGGTTPEGQTLPGLPLNKADFRHENIKDDPAKLSDTRRLIDSTIARGRKFSAPRYSMPAWARSEGGPLSPWQVKQLTDLIMSGTDEDWADMAHLREEHAAPVAEQIPAPPTVAGGGDIARSVCTRCHTLTAGATSPVPLAPNLADYATKGPYAEEMKRLKASDPDWLVKWVTNAPAVKPGTAMPAYGASAGGELSDDAVKLVVRFLLEGK
ncbi:MAG: c-type cytochrome [Chloroflexi bacterium]|nr:c-type cytochrome [Chloroflexota bacterium]